MSSKTLYCNCCKKDLPLVDYQPLGVQNTSKGELYGYMVNCKHCSSTKLIVKYKNENYKEIVKTIINNQKGTQDG